MKKLLGLAMPPAFSPAKVSMDSTAVSQAASCGMTPGGPRAVLARLPSVVMSEAQFLNSRTCTRQEACGGNGGEIADV